VSRSVNNFNVHESQQECAARNQRRAFLSYSKVQSLNNYYLVHRSSFATIIQIRLCPPFSREQIGCLAQSEIDSFNLPPPATLVTGDEEFEQVEREITIDC
jgi:hypothetical protein